MRIYLDDNAAERHLVTLLRKAGHSVTIPSEAGHTGATDPRHLLHAIGTACLLLTNDYADFTDLHELILGSGGGHPGILLVYSENDPTRDMTPRGITVAIGKLEASGMPLNNQLHVLNHWR
jgi:predicted nuclease of predicted toxin-antitoxin system